MGDFDENKDYYNMYDLSTLEMMRKIWGDDEVAIFCKLNAFKYRMRMGFKGSVAEDAMKEQDYLDKFKSLKSE